MLRNVVLSSLLLLGATLAGPSLAAGDASLHQVYEAVNAGRLDQAQSMMVTVLKDHPDSAKAHFVEAEVLARQGRRDQARAELDTARRLKPGLPFAKPESVQKLERRIDGSATSSRTAPTAYVAQPQASGGIPWAMLLMGAVLLAALIFFIRSLRPRQATVMPAGAGAGYGSGMPMQSYPGGGMASPMGTTAGGGMGSGILGGLATGAAVGAGIVAGEALMHHFTDGNRPAANPAPLAPSTDDWNAAPDDPGGNDFGIADSGSWDDASSSGDDWN